VSWILDEPSQKSTRIKICKNISTQSDLNPWWTGTHKSSLHYTAPPPSLTVIIAVLQRRRKNSA